MLRAVFFIIKRKPKLIIAADHVYDALPAIFTRRPFILVLHDTYPWRMGYISRFVANIAVKKSVKIVSPSNTTISLMPKKLREAIKHKTCVIPNPVNVQEFYKLSYEEARSWLRNKLKIEHDTKVLLYVGFISRLKGVHTLLEAFSMCVEEGENLFLLLVGRLIDEGLVARLPRQAKYLGVVPHLELLLIFKSCDIVVNPSLLMEGQGRTIIEALAAGKHVVASYCPAFVETGGEAVCYFKPGDANDLYLKLKEVIRRIDAGLKVNPKANDVIGTYRLEKFEESWTSILKGPE